MSCVAALIGNLTMTTSDGLDLTTSMSAAAFDAALAKAIDEIYQASTAKV